MSLSGVLSVLIGQQVGKIGPKNRISVPAKFRAELGKNLVVGRGFEGCLVLMSVEGFKKLANEALGGPITQRRIRTEARFLLAQAEEVGLDKQGRFVMPQYLADYAKIHNKVYFIGLMRWVEIWAQNLWERQQQTRLSE